MSDKPTDSELRLLQDMRDGVFSERTADERALRACSRRGWRHVGYDGNFQLSNTGVKLTQAPDTYLSKSYETASRRALL